MKIVNVFFLLAIGLQGVNRRFSRFTHTRDDSKIAFSRMLFELGQNTTKSHGFAARFAKWLLSSDIRIQITQESVRLVALIGLKMFLTHIACKKSLENFLLARFRRSVLGKGLKIIVIFGLL